MVKIFSLAVLLASAMVAQACSYCQCLKSDGSHCCVYSVSIPSLMAICVEYTKLVWFTS